MNLPHVFATRRIPQKGVDLLQAAVELEIWEEELPPPYEVIREKARGKDGLLTLLSDRIDAPLMDFAGPTLKVISQYAVGFDNIDVAAATQRGIRVGNTPGVLTETTADFAWALLMAAARRVAEADRFSRAGKWKTWGPSVLLGHDIYGATLGLVGFGRIGQAVARRAAGFQMRVLYTDVQRYPEAEAATGAQFVSLDELLAQADFISLHTALTPQTRHLIGAAQLAQMKPSTILINTARGPIVDEHALFEALSNGVIAGACVDVTEVEPLPASSPLYRLENIIIAPHIASASIHTRDRMAEICAQNLLAGLRGEALPFCVNPQ